MKKFNHIKQVQQGMTIYGMALVLVIVGLAATSAVKLGPHYIDNSVVKSALSDVQAGYAGTSMQDVKDSEIKGRLTKYFDVNMVSDEIAKAAKVTRDKQKVILSVNYEIRTSFIGNVDFVMVFNNEVDLAK